MVAVHPLPEITKQRVTWAINVQQVVRKMTTQQGQPQDHTQATLMQTQAQSQWQVPNPKLAGKGSEKGNEQVKAKRQQQGRR
jgi:hypothetical protein